MYQKNYICREENEIWKYIENKEIIDAELIEQIFPEIKKSKKDKILHSLCRKGYLKRVIKGLYYNPEKISSFYNLAFRIKEGYLSLSSALKYYNLLEYEDFTIFVMTKNFRKKIPIKGTKYEIQFIPLKKYFTGFEKKNDFYVSTIEKTLFDCLLKNKFVGFNTITKAFYYSRIDWRKFLSFFELAEENNSLHQRTGYVLELLKKNTKFKIPSFVFNFLLKKVKNPVKLTLIKAKSFFNKKWMVQDNIGSENILSWWFQ